MAAKTKGVKSTYRAGAESANRSRVASLVTTNHAEIRNWAEQRGGVPASVRTTRRGRAGVLRIDFPDERESSLEHIDWERWFAKFDENRLAFLYQEKTATGKLSRFNKPGTARNHRGKPTAGASENCRYTARRIESKYTAPARTTLRVLERQRTPPANGAGARTVSQRLRRLCPRASLRAPRG